MFAIVLLLGLVVVGKYAVQQYLSGVVAGLASRVEQDVVRAAYELGRADEAARHPRLSESNPYWKPVSGKHESASN